MTAADFNLSLKATATAEVTILGIVLIGIGLKPLYVLAAPSITKTRQYEVGIKHCNKGYLQKQRDGKI